MDEDFYQITLEKQQGPTKIHAEQLMWKAKKKFSQKKRRTKKNLLWKLIFQQSDE